MNRRLCVKCASIAGTSVRYCGGGKPNGPYSMCPPDEHLHITCSRCGYSATETTANAKPQPKYKSIPSWGLVACHE